MKKILALCLFVFINSSCSQINIKSPPEDFLKESLRAIQEQDYVSFVQLLHPDAISQFTKLINLLRSAELEDERLFSLFSVNTLDEFNSTSDTVLIANFLRYTLAHSSKNESPTISDPTIIGKVNEGDDIIHIVYRNSITANSITISKVQVESLKQSKYGWRLLLKGDLESVLETLSKRLE